jgi:hypothetical protein
MPEGGTCVLSYRTLLTINPQPEDNVVQGVIDKTVEWLRDKNLDVDALLPNSEVTVSANARVKWIAPDSAEFVGTQRLILTEESQAGNWVSTLTVRQPSDGRPWFWMDVEGPNWAGAPRLVSSLIENYSCSDRGVRLTKRPVIIRPQQVDELIRLLGRPGRRTLSFIAGSSAGLPMKAWKEFVGDLLKQTIGQASGYVLDPVATTIFNQRVGESFGVRPGMLRTYLPELNILDPQDAARHRFLTSESIATQNVGRLRKTLSYRAREVTQAALLDDGVRLLDRRLEEAELLMELPPSSTVKAAAMASEIVAPKSSPSPNDGTVASHSESQSARDQQTAVPSELERAAEPQVPEATVGEQADIYLALRALVEEFTGSAPSAGSVEVVRELLEAGRDAEKMNTRLLAKIDQSSAALDAATVEQDRLRHLIDDLELDAWETWELLEAQTATARGAQDAELKLRALLAGSGAEVDWTELEDTAAAELAIPENFNSLVESFTELPFVVYTGNKDTTASLDNHDAVGQWCVMTWSILAALNDYARLKAEGMDVGGVHTYLECPPPGGRTYPPGRHARDESETVKQNPSFSGPRTLPVPKEVDESGKAFMGAHFRIAKHGMVSPRLHYIDATATCGKIIVGYIGPHLPNTQTN